MGWSSAAQKIVDTLFVYGSLGTGQTARSLIAEHVTRSESATVTGRIYAFPDGYPGLVNDDDATVVGELLHLTDLMTVFALLDAYEGDDFKRSMRQVTTESGAKSWAWCYELADPKLADEGELVANGDWSTFRPTD